MPEYHASILCKIDEFIKNVYFLDLNLINIYTDHRRS
jgi:hypothetical protein